MVNYNTLVVSKGKLKRLKAAVQNNEMPSSGYNQLPLEKLEIYYRHQIDLLKGYEKNPDRLREHMAVMGQWIEDIGEFKKVYVRVSGYTV